ncbi:hypothetical protein D3C86_1720740 [compost metagenome]
MHFCTQVKLLQLAVVHLVNSIFFSIFPWDLLSIGCKHKCRAQVIVVRNHYLIVFSDMRIHFEGSNTQVNGMLHGNNGIFRHQSPPSPMPFGTESREFSFGCVF